MSELTKEFVTVDDISSVMQSGPEDASSDRRDESLLTTDIIMEDYDQHSVTDQNSPLICHPAVNWSSIRPVPIAAIENEYSHDARNIFINNNYLRGCKWSPDGSCLLTQSFDNTFRLFEFDQADFENDFLASEPTPKFRIEENYPVLDYCWYPFMNSNNDLTCVFISARERSSIRMWDSMTGALRCTYLPTNLNNEIEDVKSIAFSSDGSCIFCGFKRFIKVINTEHPTIMRRIPNCGQKPKMKGIVSAISTPPYSESSGSGLYALGTFNGTVNVYSMTGESEPIIECVNTGSRGVSQLMFLSDRFLIAGGRVDGMIRMWDLAGTSKEPCLTLHRRVENYQRFHFDVDSTGTYLFTGNQTGAVFCYNLSTGELESSWRAHDDSCNGISIHPSKPILATAAGQRRPVGMPDDSEELDEDEMPRNLTDEEAVMICKNPESCELPMRNQLHLLPIRKEVKLWKFPYAQL
nr:WD repeat containing antisense to TP53 [Hymenolepis microstoma]